MDVAELGSDTQTALAEVLGYLNFSSGTPDAKFLRNLNTLFFRIEEDKSNDASDVVLKRWLIAALHQLSGQGGAFADAGQSQAVITLLFDELLPAYRRFHRDLLQHQTDVDLWQPFFIGRAIEAILVQGPPWDEHKRLVTTALSTLNDFVGYRPVAVLESDRKIEPYENEWVRPIPLYIEEAGVACGRYEALVAKALEILNQTDSDLLAQAWFDPNLVEELTLDPRAYDFDHPVSKRPNYHFGTWDPHDIDNQGRYRRFVVQQITLDALLARVDTPGDLPEEEWLVEAAAVLSGTILMASATSGSGPDSHRSDTTLATLLPHIAEVRDQFYQQFAASVGGAHGRRLRRETKQLKQPLGGARQHLNQEISRRRAVQLQRVHLAQLFARMGYPDAASRQAHAVEVASARMLSQIYCQMTAGHHAIETLKLAEAAERLREIEDLLERAIECGALIDPWNIVGFGGNFSLFPALENSIRDYRADDLIELMEKIFGLCARAWSEAAAVDDEPLERSFSETFARLAGWWDRFATSTVSSVKRLVGKELEVSTNLVAGALNAWHKAGAAAGDIGFWRMFVQQFDSPKAFHLVIDALLEKKDYVASQALLMQWLSQADQTELEEGHSSLSDMLVRWMQGVERSAKGADDDSDDGSKDGEHPWPMVCKFFELLEANAQEYWQVPKLDLEGADSGNSDADDDQDSLLANPGEADDEDDYLYKAAYEEMTYQDSTDDGVEGFLLEPGGGATDFELDAEAKRLGQRLVFLATVARLWRRAVMTWGTRPTTTREQEEAFDAWQRQAVANHADLVKLLEKVHHYRISTPTGDQESLVEYDRRRMTKDALLERVITTCVETSDAVELLKAANEQTQSPTDKSNPTTVALLRTVLAEDPDAVQKVWPDFLEAIQTRELLYVPLARGGNPKRIVQVRSTLQTVLNVVGWLPRLGCLRETCQLLEAAQTMEADHPVGPGAVTEFDRLFAHGYRALVRAIVASAEHWDTPESDVTDLRTSDSLLVECLKQLTQSQSELWLLHSRTLRLSVVEKVADPDDWQQLVEFVQRYGDELFTQHFLNLGNLRAILHQGVDTWLRNLEEDRGAKTAERLLDDLDGKLPRAEAVKHLTVVLEAVVENYTEYRDYNVTTTQSDRGELLYMFIDFLRLKSKYDRVAWNLHPVVMAHEILTRCNRSQAAELWRRSLAEESREAADRYLVQLGELSDAYGMRLATVADRIGERFIQPLAIDRVRGLVRPAMEDARHDRPSTAFSLLEEEIEAISSDPSGAGLDLPAWLEALETEVSDSQAALRQEAAQGETDERIAQILISADDVQAQLS